MAATPSGFANRAFYLHTAWMYDYPLAVRKWSRADFLGMFRLLSMLGINRVMFWPLTEVMPPPLSPSDQRVLARFRQLVADAHSCGLQCWLVFTANVTSAPEVARKPYEQRTLPAFPQAVPLDDPAAKSAYFAHRAQIFSHLNNADGYVTIDGDPGGYPGARPEAFLDVLRHDRAVLDRCGADPGQQKVIPWFWAGWGADWTKTGPWGEPIDKYSKPLMELVRDQPVGGPWEILPGRSIREDWANGRLNVQLAEDLGLLERSTLLLYEIVEFEPCVPAFILQFADIRRVLAQEAAHAGKAQGVLANCQQPLGALHNLFFYARATADLSYLDKSDEQVLSDLAQFLGGPADLLTPAWRCLDLPLTALPAGLPTRLRQASLATEAACCLPGGPQRYLELLAQFVDTRIRLLTLSQRQPQSPQQKRQILLEMLQALYDWWREHHYALDHSQGPGFRLCWSHDRLRAPLDQWRQRYAPKEDAVWQGLPAPFEAL